MPFYDYQCEDCREYFEEHRSVIDRYKTRCPKCSSSRVTIKISSISVHFFDPYYDTQLGQHINSPKHKKEVAAALGLTNVGDAKLHEVEQQALSNKKLRESENQTPTPEFLKAWEKVKATIPN